MAFLLERFVALGSNLTLFLSVLVGSTALLVVGKLLIRGIINIYLHPLSAIPGPKRAAFTELYYIHTFIFGRSHLTITSKQNPVIRLCRNLMSLLERNFWGFILV